MYVISVARYSWRRHENPCSLSPPAIEDLRAQAAAAKNAIDEIEARGEDSRDAEKASLRFQQKTLALDALEPRARSNGAGRDLITEETERV